MPNRLHRLALVLPMVALLVLLSACASIGAGSVNRDRLVYSEALASSWKEQMLLNIVKLRYGDTPMFLDVSSVIASYQVQSQVSLSSALSSGLTPGVPDGTGQSLTLGAGALYIDKPTISYAPLLGEKFTRSLLRPIQPTALFQLVQAGFPIDLVFQLTTRAINGVYNRSNRALGIREADPEFYQVLDALRRVQVSEAIGFRLERRGADETALITFSTHRLPRAVIDDIRLLRDTLGIDPGAQELRLTFGDLPRDNREVAMLSRSILEILTEISGSVEVPAQDVAEGRSSNVPTAGTNGHPRDQPLVRIRAGNEAPTEPFVSVRYQRHWFWVDNRDIRSKAIFSFMLLLMSLAETGPAQQAPVLTVPAN